VGCPRIGLPRALLYHKYSTLWETFLKALGAEVIVSPPTNSAILAKGVEVAESELCLPVRLYHGHALELKGKVDAIFVPRVISVEKDAYTCPKFFGLPDLLRAADDSLPPLLTPTFNARLGRRQSYRNITDFGRSLSVGPVRTLLAWFRAEWAQERSRREPVTTTSEDKGVGLYRASDPSVSLRIGVAGHPYNLHDGYMSMDLISRLRRCGVEPLRSEDVPEAVALAAAAQLPKELYWTYEKEVVGAILHWAKTRQVDGIINVRSFSCGPDSIAQALVEYEVRRLGGVSLLPIVIDEHRAEAGLVTRVEAFLDMIQRRKAA
jgi:predicted nucleotide-binding protein (sugar kinase/HSP70/actin superfamily)